MKMPAIFVSILCLLGIVAGADAAATYRWFDANGKVHYSESPPAGVAAQEIKLPASLEVAAAAQSESTAATVQPAKNPAAPAATPAQAAAAPQVEIYMTSWCPYCRKAEAWFRERNIPFNAYDIEKDADAAKRKAELCRSRGVPLVVICGQSIPGFSEKAFEEALDDCTAVGTEP